MLPNAERIETARDSFKTRITRAGLTGLHTVEFGSINRRAGTAVVTVSAKGLFKEPDLRIMRRTLTQLHDAHQTTHVAPALERGRPVSAIEITLSLLKP